MLVFHFYLAVVLTTRQTSQATVVCICKLSKQPGSNQNQGGLNIQSVRGEAPINLHSQYVLPHLHEATPEGGGATLISN